VRQHDEGSQRSPSGTRRKAPPLDAFDRVLTAALWGVVVGAALLWVGVVGARFGFPYELEWMEGGTLAHVRRVLSGEPVYARPSLDFVAYMYPPLYYYAGAAVSLLFGEGFGPLRGLGIAATIGCFGLLYRVTFRETGDVLAGALAAGLLAASYAFTGAWLDLARLDAFYLFWLLLATERLTADETPVSARQAGFALAVAFFVKQSVLVIAAPVWVLLLWMDRRRAFAALVGAGVPIALGVFLLDWLHGGWFVYYTVQVPSGHPTQSGLAAEFWTHDLLGGFPVALFGAVTYCAVAWRGGHARDVGLFAALLVGALVATASVRSAVGAHLNNLLPLVGVLGLVGGAAFAAALREGGRVRRFALLGALAQLLWLGYDPRPLVPTAADRAAGDALVETIAGLDGEVFIPNHGYLARRAGKREFAHTLGIDNLLLDDLESDARRELELDFLRHFRERRFGAVIIDSDGRYAEFAEAFYGRGRPLFEEDDVFFSPSGGRIRPETLYLKP
jgi:hypothetical protein